MVGVLSRIETDENLLDFPFYVKDGGDWKYLYPYEEEPKKTWLEKEIHRLAIAEDDIRVVAYSVCKKILEEMENRDLSYVSATTLRNIFKDLGVELC